MPYSLFRIDLSSPNHLYAEAFGTFFLVLAGCGAIIVNDVFNGIVGHGGIALTFGMIVMIMIYAIGNISGAHMNPAVTIAFYFAGRFAPQRILPFVIAQCLGACAAATLLKLAFPDHDGLGYTQPHFSVANAFVVEFILSFGLMFVILNVSTGHMEKGIMAGVAIGGTVAIEALIGGPITGASMNPARSLAPALLSGNFSHLWLYIVAPVIGMVAAYPTCRWVQGAECCGQQACEASAQS